jgi:predicted SnoaL-like aldol condensation-catalyzing enzyme
MPSINRRILLSLLPAMASAEPAGAQTDPRAVVLAFYQLGFIEGQVAEAFARHVGPRYTQHNPRVPDGPEPAIAFLTRNRAENPEVRYEVKRVLAEGDLVMLHTHVRRSPADRGMAIVDIFRVEAGRIVEHWDVIQPVPETAANPNGMF